MPFSPASRREQLPASRRSSHGPGQERIYQEGGVLPPPTSLEPVKATLFPPPALISTRGCLPLVVMGRWQEQGLPPSARLSSLHAALWVCPLVLVRRAGSAPCLAWLSSCSVVSLQHRASARPARGQGGGSLPPWQVDGLWAGLASPQEPERPRQVFLVASGLLCDRHPGLRVPSLRPEQGASRMEA